MSTHHDHSRRVIVTLGFAATLFAVASSYHEHHLPIASPPTQVAIAH